MIVPLALLAVGAVFGGMLNLPFDLGVHAHALGHFLGQSPSFTLGLIKADSSGAHPDAIMFGQPAAHTHLDPLPLVMGGLIAIAGILLAYIMHLKDRNRAERLAASAPGLTRMLEAKYWVDEVYQNGIVEPLRSLGRAFFAADKWVIDLLVGGVAMVPQALGFALKLSTQRGYLQGYAVTMILGIAAILLFIFLR